MNLLYEAWEIVMINMCILLNRKCDVCKFSSKTIDPLRVFRYFEMCKSVQGIRRIYLLLYLEGVNEFLLRWCFFNFLVSSLRL